MEQRGGDGHEEDSLERAGQGELGGILEQMLQKQIRHQNPETGEHGIEQHGTQGAAVGRWRID